MQIKLSFLGAAQNVTGSKYLLEVNNVRVFVDCGLYQERVSSEKYALFIEVALTQHNGLDLYKSISCTF